MPQWPLWPVQHPMTTVGPEGRPGAPFQRPSGPAGSWGSARGACRPSRQLARTSVLGLPSRAQPPRMPSRCACAGAPWLTAPIRGSPPPLALSARRVRHRHGARRAGSTRRVGGLRPGGDRVRRHRGSAPRGRAPSHTQGALFAALRSSSAAGSDCDLTAVALPWPRRPSARSTRGMEKAEGLERRPLPMRRHGFE